MQAIHAFLITLLIDSPCCAANSIKAACYFGENLDDIIGKLYYRIR